VNKYKKKNNLRVPVLRAFEERRAFWKLPWNLIRSKFSASYTLNREQNNSI